jgi:hypothetical protein
MEPIIERLLPYRAPVVWTIHAVLAAAAYLLAFYIDNEFFIGPSEWNLFLGTVPLLLLVRPGTFAWFHLFEGLRNGECGMRIAEWGIRNDPKCGMRNGR